MDQKYIDSYITLKELGYMHEIVNHSIRKYSREEVHMNNCENRTSNLRILSNSWKKTIQGMD